MNNNRGVALVVALIVVLILGVFGSIFLSLSVNNSRQAQRYAQSTRSFWNAEAGVQKVYHEFKHNSCHGMVAIGTTTACVNCSSCGMAEKSLNGTFGSSDDYSVTFDRSNNYVNSVGSIAPISDTKRKIRVSLKEYPEFKYALFGKTQVKLFTAVETKSYDSRLGLEGALLADGVTINSGHEGNIGSNGPDIGSVWIGDNSDIYGDVDYVPPGTSFPHGDAEIHGDGDGSNVNVIPPFTIDPVVVPSELMMADNNGANANPISGKNQDVIGLVDGGHIDLPPGDHKYRKIDVTRNFDLNINDGDTRIYLTDQVKALDLGNNGKINIAANSSLTIYTDGPLQFRNSGFITSSDFDPRKFLIYSTYSGTDNAVDLSNNGDIYGAVKAPNGTVYIRNNGNFYGAVVGDYVRVGNNANIYYDKALGTITNTETGMNGWQEFPAP